MTQNTVSSFQENIIVKSVRDIMERSYIDYSVSVITSRALPDVRDGLKPVHRRILYAAHNLDMKPGSKHKKSARLVGDVIGKYHPHGDVSVYDAAVKMSQPWKLLHPLIDGQGNFGSTEGDSAAAMRYTEMRMQKVTSVFFHDFDTKTIDMQDNYDGSEREPTILPVRYPNLWVNGSDGIAVGMATSIPSHNLNETIDAFEAWMRNRAITDEQILEIMPGPDFPTGGTVFNLAGYKQAIQTGRGSVRLRARYKIEKNSKQESIVIYEVPWDVNTKNLETSIKNLINEGKIEDAVECRNESSGEAGLRIVVDLKRGAYPEVVFSQLLAQTECEKSISYNVMALDKGIPKQMGLRDIFEAFYDFRVEIITRRTEQLKSESLRRIHLVEGLLKAQEFLQETIEAIRTSENVEIAREKIRELLNLTDEQIKVILDMRLTQITGLERSKLENEQANLKNVIADCIEILTNRERMEKDIIAEMHDVKAKMGKPRQTEVSNDNMRVSRGDLVKKEQCIIQMTNNGYIKRMPTSALNVQNRNTQGKSTMVTNDDDYVTSLYSGSTHDLLMFFTDSGKVFAKNVWDLPEGSASAKGRHRNNLFPEINEGIASTLFVPSLETEGVSIVLATKNGKIKRTSLDEYAGALRKSGLIGINLEEDDRVVGATVAYEYDHILLGASNGNIIRFEVNEEQMRNIGRASQGVRGMNIDDNTNIISMMRIPGNGSPTPTVLVDILDENGVATGEKREAYDTSVMDVGYSVLCMGEKGVGKRTPVEEFNVQRRAGKGVIAFKINTKTGPLLKMLLVRDDEDIIMSSKSKTNRVRVSDVRVTGRNTAGTYLMDINNDIMVDIAVVPGQEPETDVATDSDSALDTQVVES